MAESSRRTNWAKEALERDKDMKPEPGLGGKRMVYNPPPEIEDKAEPEVVPAPVTTPAPTEQPVVANIKEVFFGAPGEAPVDTNQEEKYRLEKELAEAQLERKTLEGKLQAEQEMRNKAALERDELKAWRRNQELEQEFSLAGVEFNSIDPADVEKVASITRKSHANLSEELKSLRQEVEQGKIEQQRILKEHAQVIQEQASSDMRSSTNKRILQAYPDFSTMSKSPAFLSMLNQPIRPGSHITNKDELGMAYAAGDAEYIISFLKGKVEDVPQFDKIAQMGAGPVNTEVKEPVHQATIEEQDDLLTAVKLNLISRDEFRKQRQAQASAKTA